VRCSCSSSCWLPAPTRLRRQPAAAAAVLMPAHLSPELLASSPTALCGSRSFKIQRHQLNPTAAHPRVHIQQSCNCQQGRPPTPAQATDACCRACGLPVCSLA
jgi:hypothetical protein